MSRQFDPSLKRKYAGQGSVFLLLADRLRVVARTISSDLQYMKDNPPEVLQGLPHRAFVNSLPPILALPVNPLKTKDIYHGPTVYPWLLAAAIRFPVLTGIPARCSYNRATISPRELIPRDDGTGKCDQVKEHQRLNNQVYRHLSHHSLPKAFISPRVSKGS